MTVPPSGASDRAPAWWPRIAVVALVAVVALAFAAYSRQVWEDYYITFRSSRNLAEGHGLVYQVGERLHTFTSPLGVLLPAGCYALTGGDDLALWLFRIVSALALAATAALLVAHARDHRWSRGACAFALCFSVLEAKTVAFAMNGMETAFLVLFAALTWRELTRPDGPRWPWLAAGYAGLMWTRPDAFVLAGAMSLAWWALGPRTRADGERLWWKRCAVALVVGALLYAPWLAWAWHYYGSPVPQTIIAKSALTPEHFSLSRILAAPLRCLVSDTAFDGLFLPIYAAAGGWPRDFMNLGQLLARLSAFLWLVPFLPRPARAASLAALVGAVYFHQIMPYPWYYAPWTFLGAIALGGSLDAAAARLPPLGRSLGRIVAGSLAVGALLVLAAQAYACRVQQRIVEDGVRKPIGLWLHERARPTDTVFLEPIGYIGYYSQLKILDFPGLTAPEVSRMVRDGRGSFAAIIATLRPAWLVLRVTEIADQRLANDPVLADYDVVGHWDQRAALDRLAFLPGSGWIQFDAEFLLLRRHQTAASAHAE